MTVDHVGACLMHSAPWTRAIGRLALPIFAFLLVEGYKHTRDLTSYIGRLFLLAVVSQWPYSYATSGYVVKDLNIVYTLVLGLLTLRLYDKYQRLAPVLLCAVIAHIGNLDFGAGAIIMIYLFYKYGDSRRDLMLTMWIPVIWAMVRKAWIVMDAHREIDSIRSYLQVDPSIVVYPMAWLALPLIFTYNGQLGPKAKYLFYVFYPAHLLIIGLVKSYVMKQV